MLVVIVLDANAAKAQDLSQEPVLEMQTPEMEEPPLAPAAPVKSFRDQPPALLLSPQDEARLSQLEIKAFGSSYGDNDHALEDRLDHLEREVLGASQIGDPGERLNRLEHRIIGGSGFGGGQPVQSDWMRPIQTMQQLKQVPDAAIAAQQDVMPAVAPPRRRPVPAGPTPGTAIKIDAQTIAGGLVYDTKSSDYLASIMRLDNGNQANVLRAHFTQFPVVVRLPKETPEGWQKTLEATIARWNQYVPVKMALPNEPSDIDCLWVNKLPDRCLAVARLEINQGVQKVRLFLLRPSFYPKQVSERQLAQVFAREIGHGLGLWGKSDSAQDLMFQSDKAQAPARGVISNRDINTLKRVLQSPAPQEGPGGLTLDKPMEWATTY